MERPGDEMERELQEFQERRRQRQERRKRRMLTAVIVTVLALVLTGLTAYLTYQRGMRNLGLSSMRPAPAASNTAPAPDAFGGDLAAIASGRVNVLVLGTDEDVDNVGRTDTIMLVSFDPRTGDAGVLSIPRDTRVEIPGRTGFHRINVANALGGPELVMRTVERLLGVNVHHFVAVSFTGFERFIDALGGVEVDIPRPMRYDDFAQGLHIDLKPGRQVLNGREALHYVRYRADGLGDVSLVDPVRGVYDGRVRRQLEFVQLVAKKAMSLRSLPRLPQLVQEVFGMVSTDISVDRALALAVSARQLDGARVETAVLPGMADTIGGASYWVHDPPRTRVVVDRVVRGLDVITVEVLNGSGRSGAATRAADWLRISGYDVVRVGNAASGLSYERTQVIVHRDGLNVNGLLQVVGGELVGADADAVATPPPVQRDAAFVSQNTGVASANVNSGTANVGGPDVTVILGTDFQG